ncbi:MAG: DNA polymerase III subunit epsilon, partial [Zoogloeaceae bacterium]|nr:DNA polymerase III subunit epsilon [Zoogloeaceae bacterium]
MRQIFLDTETTGLEHRYGHRIIEIAGVEMLNRRLTGRNLHLYVNPEREIDAVAMKVHGIKNEMLEDKPKFAQIAEELREFIRDAELVIHNAPFDIGFLDAEFARLDLPATKTVCASVRDTYKMARELHPGKKNSLDALCERYMVNNAHRKLHGALLDAELLAAVYIAMTRGQESL